MDMAKEGARAAGVRITDLSVGASDMAVPEEALEALRVRACACARARMCVYFSMCVYYCVCACMYMELCVRGGGHV